MIGRMRWAGSRGAAPRRWIASRLMWLYFQIRIPVDVFPGVERYRAGLERVPADHDSRVISARCHLEGQAAGEDEQSAQPEAAEDNNA